jgi:hypothetical protein
LLIHAKAKVSGKLDQQQKCAERARIPLSEGRINIYDCLYVLPEQIIK